MKHNLLLNPIRKAVVLFPIVFLYSCHNYFKVAAGPGISKRPDSVILAYPHRYFILRSGNDALYMGGMELSPDHKTLQCKLDTVPEEHSIYLKTGLHGNNRYKLGKPDTVVLSEVHFFITNDSNARPGLSYTLNLEKVQKVEILVKDKGRTTESYILGGLGITLGVVAVAAIIVAALKSSCPFVSAHDSSGLSLQGEIYGGAIYPQLARNDYLQLKMTPLPNGNLQVRISNELKERQFTDLAELMVITHKKDIQIRVDQNGNIFSISNPESPLSAKSGDHDILALVKAPNDQKVFAFDDTVQMPASPVELRFARPAKTRKAKLILQLKNSYWLDLTYGKMIEGFGAYYSTFIKNQHSRPLADLKRWTNEQQLPMSVSLKTRNGWKQIENIMTFGPLANRETVIPLDLDSTDGSEINVRLSCGFMFWELDYAAIDFSGAADYTLVTISPKKAIDETGRDVTALINKADGEYLEQPVPGNAADIEYAFTPNTDSSKIQTFILHAKGYYEHVRNFHGAPNIAFLKQFKKPDALSQFSLQLYRQAMGMNPGNFGPGNTVVVKNSKTTH
ncbi:MAG TPA: hypothetical protein VGI38_01300 [Puia sp.]